MKNKKLNKKSPLIIILSLIIVAFKTFYLDKKNNTAVEPASHYENKVSKEENKNTIANTKNLEFSKNELWVMTYNVENLFDTKDDPGKNDETYLPIKLKRGNKDITRKCKQARKSYWVKECLETNWNDFKLEMKLKRLTKVISSFNSGDGPDILILQELENLSVLNLLKKHLRKQNYIQSVLIEGPDKRGIDVGILSKVPLKKEPRLHLQDFNKQKPTRGILEATFKVSEKQDLTVLGLHFPSQGTPTEYRRKALNKLNSILNTIPKSNIVIAGGDFNITESEERQHKLFSKELSKKWSVSHLVGCENCKGSHYYHKKRSWSFLDALLFSKNLSDNKGWELDKDSITVYSSSGIQNNRYGSPAKFNDGQYKTGVSDHWPVAARIKLN